VTKIGLGERKIICHTTRDTKNRLLHFADDLRVEMSNNFINLLLSLLIWQVRRTNHAYNNFYLDLLQ